MFIQSVILTLAFLPRLTSVNFLDTDIGSEFEHLFGVLNSKDTSIILTCIKLWIRLLQRQENA